MSMMDAGSNPGPAVSIKNFLATREGGDMIPKGIHHRATIGDLGDSVVGTTAMTPYPLQARMEAVSWQKYNERERFWKRVEETPTCWVWRGLVTQYGYGRLTVKKKLWRAHRFAWYLTHGMVPRGHQQIVCHRCNNKLCVKPSHLYIGNHKTNAADAIEDGTFNLNQHLKGIPTPVKLTWPQVCKIRELRQQGVVVAKLATTYNISLHTAKSILHWRSWKQEPTYELSKV